MKFQVQAYDCKHAKQNFSATKACIKKVTYVILCSHSISEKTSDFVRKLGLWSYKTSSSGSTFNRQNSFWTKNVRDRNVRIIEIQSLWSREWAPRPSWSLGPWSIQQLRHNSASSISTSMPGLINPVATRAEGGSYWWQDAGTVTLTFDDWKTPTTFYKDNYCSYGNLLYNSIRRTTAWCLHLMWSSWWMKGLDGVEGP